MSKLLLLLPAIVLSTTLQAASISPSDALANWSRQGNPLDGQNANSWQLSGTSILFPANSGGALISDFSHSGNFTFSTRIQSTGSDNDRYGLAFGWTDPANNYRFSWEGGGYGEANGTRGLALIREVAGTSVNLYSLSSTYWASQAAYDVSVGRTGNNVTLLVKRVSDGVIIANTSVTDTTFLTGKVGLWNESQSTLYSNLDYSVPADPSAVPEPSSVILTAAGLAGSLFLRRRTGK